MKMEALTEIAEGKKQSMDWTGLRGDFPILDQKVHGHPLIYFDNAATSQKPRAVIQALVNYYERDNANVHRGIHELSNRASAALFLNVIDSNSDHFSNVNTCVYEPSVLRVLATWPRAPMYLPVPPKTGRTTDLPASNSGADGE